jgi:tetratricopeptide (TPR) repeat protein
MRAKKTILTIFIIPMCLFVTAGLFSFSFFEEGERLYMENKLEEAADMLEAAISEDPENEKSYLYLSSIYEKWGEYDRAISIIEEGLPFAKQHTADMYLYMGNSLVSLDELERAEESYSKAINTKSRFDVAYLQRANTRVQKKSFQGAIDDYTLYLRLKPDTHQRENIEKVIDLLKGRLAEEERLKRQEEQRRIEEERRRLEEERRRQEEEKRKAEEERKRKEEERRKREEEKKRQEQLLQDILNSLNNAEKNENDLSADSEDIEDFDLELELEESR